MATFRYNITASHSATGFTYDHYHAVNIGDINKAVASTIPQYSNIQKVYMYCMAKTSLPAKADAWWVLSNNAPYYDNGIKLYSAKERVGNSNVSIASNMNASYYSNMSATSGQLSSAYSKLAIAMTATVIRKYTCSSAYVEWTYSLPTYTINLSANGQGTVTGGGKQEITQFNNSIKSGGSWTFKATPKAGYIFIGWRRVGYTGYITYDNNYTYTISRIWNNETVENIEGVFEKIPSGVYLKQNGAFVQAENVFVKQGGQWVQTDKSAFDKRKKYRVSRV